VVPGDRVLDPAVLVAGLSLHRSEMLGMTILGDDNHGDAA